MAGTRSSNPLPPEEELMPITELPSDPSKLVATQDDTGPSDLVGPERATSPMRRGSQVSTTSSREEQPQSSSFQATFQDYREDRNRHEGKAKHSKLQSQKQKRHNSGIAPIEERSSTFDTNYSLPFEQTRAWDQKLILSLGKKLNVIFS